MNIIRSQTQIADASTEDLLASYNALTGESVARFSSRAAAERRVAMAILSATDRTAHAGVQPNTAVIVPKTVDELPLAVATDATQEPREPSAEEVAPAESENPFKPGTMAHGLWVATESAKRANIEKRAAPKAPAAAKAPKITAVIATFAGISKLQAESRRCAVLRWIEKQPAAGASIEEIAAAFAGENFSTHIQKLLARDHLKPVAIEALDKARKAK